MEVNKEILDDDLTEPRKSYFIFWKRIMYLLFFNYPLFTYWLYQRIKIYQKFDNMSIDELRFAKLDIIISMKVSSELLTPIYVSSAIYFPLFFILSIYYFKEIKDKVTWFILLNPIIIALAASFTDTITHKLIFNLWLNLN